MTRRKPIVLGPRRERSMRRTYVIGAVSLVALSVAGIALAAAAPTTLFGSVGPGFSITLRDAQGNAVTRVEPGEFEIEVDDKSEEHNFHLSGPGVDVSTDVAEVRKQTFKVTLANGRYTFVCDPHALQMRGAFTVGAESGSGRRHDADPAVRREADGPGGRAALVDRRSRIRDLAQDACGPQGDAAPAGRLHRHGAGPVDESQRPRARRDGDAGDRSRVRRDADLARRPAQGDARHPVRPAQGDDASDGQGGVASGLRPAAREPFRRRTRPRPACRRCRCRRSPAAPRRGRGSPRRRAARTSVAPSPGRRRTRRCART